MRLFKFIFIFLWFIAHGFAGEIRWSDAPIQYKRHFEVRTYFIDEPSSYGSLGHYATYVVDLRYPDSSRYYISYAVFSQVESHAAIAHRMAVQWLVEMHAHLRVDIYENEPYIDAPVVPDAPRSGRRPTTTFQHDTEILRVRSEPNSQRTKRIRDQSLDSIEEDPFGLNNRNFFDGEGGNHGSF